MSYVDTLNTTQKHNQDVLIQRMQAKGVTNPYTQAAILAIVSKESGFIPKRESSYRTTDNARIRSIFTKLKGYSDADLNTLKANDEAFFNAIYGGMYGNAANDGFKYRGGGYNQLTFKDNYKSIGNKIGYDLVSAPDGIDDPSVAADALIQFFQDQIQQGAKLGKLSQYNATNINDFKNETDSLNAIYNANAGWGTSAQVINADATGGKAKASSRIEDILSYIKSAAGSVAQGAEDVAQGTEQIVKKNPALTALITAGGIVAIYTLIKLIRS